MWDVGCGMGGMKREAGFCSLVSRTLPTNHPTTPTTHSSANTTPTTMELDDT